MFCVNTCLCIISQDLTFSINISRPILTLCLRSVIMVKVVTNQVRTLGRNTQLISRNPKKENTSDGILKLNFRDFGIDNITISWRTIHKMIINIFTNSCISLEVQFFFLCGKFVYIKGTYSNFWEFEIDTICLLVAAFSTHSLCPLRKFKIDRSTFSWRGDLQND